MTGSAQDVSRERINSTRRNALSTIRVNNNNYIQLPFNANWGGHHVHYAGSNLNDGVKVNYARLQDVLEKI